MPKGSAITPSAAPIGSGVLCFPDGATTPARMVEKVGRRATFRAALLGSNRTRPLSVKAVAPSFQKRRFRRREVTLTSALEKRLTVLP